MKRNVKYLVMTVSALFAVSKFLIMLIKSRVDISDLLFDEEDNLI